MTSRLSEYRPPAGTPFPESAATWKTRMGRTMSPIQVARQSSTAAKAGGKLIAFGLYDGKFSHLSWLLPLLPDCHHYCEPFVGSAAVLPNRKPSPVETYNDVDGESCNFFAFSSRKAGNGHHGRRPHPFFREEPVTAVSKDADRISDVERARRFHVRARQTRTGLAQTASLWRWANCKNTSRAGMSGRFRDGWEAPINCPRSPDEVVKLYDDPGTLF